MKQILIISWLSLCGAILIAFLVKPLFPGLTKLFSTLEIILVALYTLMLLIIALDNIFGDYIHKRATLSTYGMGLAALLILTIFFASRDYDLSIKIILYIGIIFNHMRLSPYIDETLESEIDTDHE